jgi:two-component system, LuxR family, response regulator FixJ
LLEDDLLTSRSAYIIDDDREVRRSISFMLGATEIQPHPFANGADFLDALGDLQPGCILLDIRMPQPDGFQVLAELKRREVDWPVIVMTGHGEVPVAVRAMKLGAVDFLEKPFSEDTLLACFENAWPILDEREEVAGRRRDAKERVGALTAREREVLEGLLAGHSNKSLALQLGVSLRTVEMHRGNMMERLRAGSLAEALTLAIAAGVEPAPAPRS